MDVLGLDTMHVEPTPAAVRRGLAEAFRADELVMVGAGYGRGERLKAETPSPSLLIPVTNISSHVGRVWKTA